MLLLKTDTTVRVRGRGRPWVDHEMKRTGVQQTEGRDRGVSAYTQAYSFTHPPTPFSLSLPYKGPC